jgi:hypothetical protein
MSDPVHVLLLDLLEWLNRTHRSYEDTMDSWRTSCPKLAVWEEAVDRGFVAIDKGHGVSAVRLTPSGRSFLNDFRPENR